MKNRRYNSQNTTDTQQKMRTKSTIQTIMNTTREKLNLGKFEEKTFQIEDIIIKNNKIQKSFDNYTIVHLTDIHLGQWLNQERLDGVVHLTNNINPDLVVMTGDFLSYQTKHYLHELTESLKKLTPKDKSISVLGNHDHWTNPIEVKKITKKCWNY